TRCRLSALSLLRLGGSIHFGRSAGRVHVWRFNDHRGIPLEGHIEVIVRPADVPGQIVRFAEARGVAPKPVGFRDPHDVPLLAGAAIVVFEIALLDVPVLDVDLQRHPHLFGSPRRPGTRLARVGQAGPGRGQGSKQIRPGHSLYPGEVVLAVIDVIADADHLRKVHHGMFDDVLFVRADGRVHPADDWPAVFADFRADPPTCHIFQGGLFLSQCFFARIRKCEIDEHRQENDAGDNSDHALCTHDAPSSLAARPWAYFFCRLDLATRPAAVHYCGLNSSGGGGSMRMAVFQSVYVSTSRRSGVKTSRGNSSSAIHTTNSSGQRAGAGTVAIQSRHRSPFTKRFASLRTLPAIRITSSDWSRVSVPRGPAPQLAVRNLLSCVITQRDPSFL